MHAGNMKLFIFGVGYSGRATARAVIGRGGQVSGTTRSAVKAEKLRGLGVVPYLFDGTEISDDIASTLAETTHLLVSVAPGAADPVLAAGRAAIEAMPALRWIGYFSTVGIYGDHHGAWVDETTQCEPVTAHSLKRLETEREWQALGEKTGTPVAILRLPGIYGPGRNALLNLENGTARRIVKPGQVFNRIHVDDIAGVTLLLAETKTGGIFNVTDDEPAPTQDMVAYAAGLMGVEPPPETPFDEADMTPMARSFYGENKRVSNAKIKAQGYRFRFPDYRIALSHMWTNGVWRGEAG